MDMFTTILTSKSKICTDEAALANYSEQEIEREKERKKHKKKRRKRRVVWTKRKKKNLVLYIISKNITPLKFMFDVCVCCIDRK